MSRTQTVKQVVFLRLHTDLFQQMLIDGEAHQTDINTPHRCRAEVLRTISLRHNDDAGCAFCYGTSSEGWRIIIGWKLLSGPHLLFPTLFNEV
jgi:hypothetical protein